VGAGTVIPEVISKDHFHQIIAFQSTSSHLCGRASYISRASSAGSNQDDIRVYTVELPGDKVVGLDKFKVEALVSEIIPKSSGVFLLVVAVVRSLLEGVCNRDTIEELRERVKEMPTELESIYRHTLGKIRAKYQPQAAEMLQIMAVNFSSRQGAQGKGFIYPLPAIQLSFALEIKLDVMAVPIAHINPAYEARIIKQLDFRMRS
jgi:hypothetical protein